MRPPGAAVRLVERAVPAEDRDAVVGDLVEEFRERARRGRRGARAWFWVQAWLLALGFGLAAARERWGARGGNGAPAARGGGGGRSPRLDTGAHGARGGTIMEGWLGDLRLAVRALARRPGFAGMAVATLALGIGAGTAVFSVVQGVLLRPHPFEDARSLVWTSDGRRASGRTGSSQSLPNLHDLAARSRALEAVAPHQFRNFNIATGAEPVRARGLLASANFLDVLRVSPALGRGFTPGDEEVGGPPVAVISHGLWTGRMDGDPAALGGEVALNGEPHTVVGILPEDFAYPYDPEILVPLRWRGSELSRRSRQYNAVARLTPGTTVEDANRELAALFARLAADHPEENEGWITDVRPFGEWVVGPRTRRSLGFLTAAVVLVLVIACANVANLLLVRAEGRSREIAVRVALGAGRARLLPFFVSEGLVLSVAGGVLGVVGAYGSLGLLVRLASLPRSDEIVLDGAVLGFALLLSLATGLAVGVLPALRRPESGLHDRLRAGARGDASGGSRLLGGLLVAEVALTVLLVTAAGLMVHSFWRLTSVDLGLEGEERVLTFQVSPPPASYPDRASLTAYLDEALAAIGRLPGVQSVGTTTRLPLNGGTNVDRVPSPVDPALEARAVEVRLVTPDFFEALGLERLEGRLYEPADQVEGEPLVIVTRTLARTLFPGGDAVGARIETGMEGTDPETGAPVASRIVGVVSDFRDLGPTRSHPPAMYFLRGRSAWSSAYAVFLVRTSGDPLELAAPIRRELRRLDPTLPLYDTRLLTEVIAQRYGSQRFSTRLLATFAVLALVVGAVGIYGVMSFSVAQRTREMGVRRALGATGGEVTRLVLGRAARLVGAGLVLGLAGSLAGNRLVRDRLFEVDATDPATYAAVALLLGAVAVLACWVPARRAARVDPLEALREA